MVTVSAFGRLGFFIPSQRGKLGYTGLTIGRIELPPVAYHYDGNGFTTSRDPIPFEDLAIDLEQQTMSPRFRIINGVVGMTDMNGRTTTADICDVFFC